MASLNRVLIAGNLTRDPEMRQTTNGTANAVFTLAINRQWRDASGEMRKEACFVPIKTWSGVAETCTRYLRKGARALVEGRIVIRGYKSKDGSNRTFTEVVADRVTFLDRPSTTGKNPEVSATIISNDEQDGLEVTEDLAGCIPF